MKLRMIIMLGIVCLVLLVGPMVFSNAVLGNTSAIKLQPTAAFAGPISQALAGPNTSGATPVYGKDFTLNKANYFDNNVWAVISIKPLNNSLNGSTTVLHQQNGDYQIVLAPSSAFPSSIMNGLPADLQNYLMTQRLVYVSPN